VSLEDGANFKGSIDMSPKPKAAEAVRNRPDAPKTDTISVSTAQKQNGKS